MHWMRPDATLVLQAQLRRASRSPRGSEHVPHVTLSDIRTGSIITELADAISHGKQHEAFVVVACAAQGDRHVPVYVFHFWSSVCASAFHAFMQPENESLAAA